MTLPDPASLYTEPDLYDAEFAGYRADVPFYRHARERHPGTWLELGCGTGRLWAALDGAGYLGVDRSAAMLGGFCRRAARRGVPCPPLVCAPVQHLPLRPRSVSLVVLAYNLVQHLGEMPALVAGLREAARVVEPGGGVALDAFMPPAPGQERQDAEFGWVEARRGPAGEVLHVAERTCVDPSRGVQTTRLRFQAPAGGEPTELVVARRLWPAEALRWAVQQAGLEPAVVWGDVDGVPWTARSPRLLLLARRG